MKLEKFLANNEKFRCGCESCEALFSENLAELQERFQQFDFQQRGVAFVARVNDVLGIAVNRPLTDIWVARLVINDQTTLLQTDGFSAAGAVDDLFSTLNEIQDILSDETQQFLTEFNK